jgi:hypothetical protein
VVAPQQHIDHLAARRKRLAQLQEVLLEAEDRSQRRLGGRACGSEHRLLDVLAPLGQRIDGREVAVDYPIDQAVDEVGHREWAAPLPDHRREGTRASTRGQVIDLWEALVMDGDQILGAPEELQLGDGDAARSQIGAGRIEHAEVVARILVELGSLVAAHHVFQGERVEPERALEPGDIVRLGFADVDPDQVLSVNVEPLASDVVCREHGQSVPATLGPGTDVGDQAAPRADVGGRMLRLCTLATPRSPVSALTRGAV